MVADCVALEWNAGGTVTRDEAIAWTRIGAKQGPRFAAETQTAAQTADACLAGAVALLLPLLTASRLPVL